MTPRRAKTVSSRASSFSRKARSFLPQTMRTGLSRSFSRRRHRDSYHALPPRSARAYAQVATRDSGVGKGPRYWAWIRGGQPRPVAEGILQHDPGREVAAEIEEASERA